jgi:hypothetical protein
LAAGLWPFHAPSNQVAWSEHTAGLRFGRHGSIVSLAPFQPSPGLASGPASIEIWLNPDRLDGSGTILAFYRPETRTVSLALRQSLDDLLVQLPSSPKPDPKPDPKTARIYAPHVFAHRRPVLLTISSGPSGTTVYAEGTFLRQFPSFKFFSSELAGQLVIGNSPGTTHTWSGELNALAIYDRELSAVEAAEHYAILTKNGPSPVGSFENAIALYLFQEEQGRVVHNLAGGPPGAAADLVIPERFFVLNAQFLETPWSEYHANWAYWRNVAINIGGFVPLGFFFFACFSSAGSNARVVAAVIVLGFLASLTIEVGQAFLPTRDSGITDLITNTLGTALGVALCASLLKRNLATAASVLAQSAGMDAEQTSKTTKRSPELLFTE